MCAIAEKEVRPSNFKEQRLQQLIDECQKTVLEQIIQPFGLSMAMFNDKDGGDVDTVHNVRKGVYATEKEKEKYDNRGEYNSSEYHSHKNYKKKNAEVKEQKESGNLQDAYTGKNVSPNSKVDLDHTISAKEAHDDAGAYLAEKNTKDLVNQASNLNATNSTINRAKKQKTTEEFIKDWEKKRPERQKKIEELSQKTQLTDKERKELEKLKKLEEFSPEEARKIEKAARKAYEKEINKYYKSGKFIKNTAKAAGMTAAKTAIQQAVGMLLVEFAQASFHEVKMFFKERSTSSKNIFKDIKDRLANVMSKVLEKLKKWKEIAQTMADGFLSGFFSSLVTTFINIFATTAKKFVRAIREGIRSLVQSFKLLFFRPQDMSEEDALKTVIKSLSGVFITTVGIAAETALNTFLQSVPVIGQFASVITPVLLGILSGISIALVSYLVDSLFDLFHKTEREFDSLLKISNLAIANGESIEIVFNNYIAMGRNFEEMQRQYDNVITSNTDIKKVYKDILDNNLHVLQSNSKVIGKQKAFIEGSSNHKTIVEKVSVSVNETEKWLNKKR